MELELVLGRSGYGKTRYLMESLIQEAVKHPEQKYFVIVPEQYTMQMQREIILMHPNKGAMNIDILSFHRLAYRIFDEQCVDTKEMLSEIGMNMMLRKVLEENKKQFCYFTGSFSSAGFIDKMKSMLSEFVQYEVTPGKILTMSERLGEGSALYYKCKDLALIYEAFLKEVEGKYLVGEQILYELGNLIPGSKMLQGATIYLDSYTGFTPIQYTLLDQLMKYVKKIVCTLTMEEATIKGKVKEHQLFYFSKIAATKLKELAIRRGGEIKETYLNTPYRFQDSKELLNLERSLFQYPFTTWEEETKDIKLVSVMNPKEEMDFAAKTIARMVRSNHYHYRDFAVICGDLEGSRKEVESIFTKLDIPFFFDQNQQYSQHPLMTGILGVLEMIEKNYSYESVFLYLKSGISRLDSSQVEELENYILATGIRGKNRYQKEFKRRLRHMQEDSLEKINEIRSILIDEVSQLEEAIGKKHVTVREIVKALYDFIVNHEMYERIRKRCEVLENKGEIAKAKADSKLYEKVMELFDEMVTILGEQELPLKEVRQILETGFSGISVGVIPPSLDQVIIGDMQRTRISNIKVLFFLHMNDGIVPASKENSGIFNDMERQSIGDKGLELAFNQKTQTFFEQYYLYLCLSKPSEKLYLSFSKTGRDQSSLRTSYVLSRLKKIFPQITVIENVEPKGEFTLEHFLERFLLLWKKDSLTKEEEKELALLYGFLNEREDAKRVLSLMIQGKQYKNEELGLEKETAGKLYELYKNYSVSLLEQYAECPFSYFVRYGLELKEREEYKVNSMQLGTIFHDVIDLFSKEATDHDLWKSLKDQERDAKIEELVDQVVAKYDTDIFECNSRNQYMLHHIKRISKRTAWALQKQILRGDFNPAHFELSFEHNRNILTDTVIETEGNSLELKGIIDRVDRYEEEDKVYLKIVDYKSGATTFDLVDFYAGIRMQLIIYMNAMMQIEKNKQEEKQVIPAGFFYYELKDPYVERKEKESIEDTLLKELKLEGYANLDYSCISHLESAADGKKLVIPVSYTKAGEISANSKVLSNDSIKMLQNYAKYKAEEIVASIQEGEIEIKPVRTDDKNPCEYCGYSGICHFDARINGCRDYRKLTKVKAMELMGEEIEKRKEEK